MPFAGTDLAARIERAECQMLIDFADAVRANCPGSKVVVVPIGNAVATLADMTSPINKVAGLGFDRPPDLERQLDAVESLWSQRSTPVQVELSTLADPAIGALLTSRGYILRGFENVLACTLPRPPSSLGPRDRSIEVGLNPPDKLREWIDLVVDGFAAPDVQGVPSHESFPREAVDQIISATASAAGLSRFLARRNGAPAGGASLRIHEGIAQMCGAATIPQHRRRGVQGALLEFRLDAAARAGCDLCVVTTLPGSKSQENVQRRGFELLYTRAILVREPR